MKVIYGQENFWLTRGYFFETMEINRGNCASLNGKGCHKDFRITPRIGWLYGKDSV